MYGLFFFLVTVLTEEGLYGGPTYKGKLLFSGASRTGVTVMITYDASHLVWAQRIWKLFISFEKWIEIVLIMN